MVQEIDPEKLTGAQQILVLKQLKQQAAAWLLGLNARTLRDLPDLTRADGTHYDARDVISDVPR